ncbi:MAG TPA: radical SAM protein [Phycisphaerae bacterium]|nr:radical SAM protein [Phycisphaerae bacterium]
MVQPASAGGRLRSRDIVGMMSGRSLWRIVRGAARAPFDERFAGSPLAVCWFTNFSCNARCPFCCKAAEIRAGQERWPPLGLTEARALLARIRRTVDILYISGGEPLVHPHIVEILQEARRLAFSAVGMSSNLILLDRRVEVLEHLDAISVSIHSPDVAVHARNLALPVAQAEKAFAHLDQVVAYARARRAEAGSRPLTVVVNCVINPDNLDTVLGMVEFTRTRGCLLELVPANDHGGPDARLVGNPAYEGLIDALLALRRSGSAPHLAGSTGYYRRIRSFAPFRCFPYGVPNIMPDGSLCTPCDVAGQYAVNVLDHESLKAALAASQSHLGAYPCREGRCFKAGIIERSRLFGALMRRDGK